MGRGTVKSADLGLWVKAAALGGALAMVLLALGYAYLAPQRQSPVASPSSPPRPPSKQAVLPVTDAPSPDLATEASSAPYVLRRQRVYYRSTHPVGTIIISRSQRFLYVVQPSQVAIRYAIGVGPECENVAGLFLISAKVDHPGTRESGPSLVSAGSIGPRALYFDQKRAVHGTSEPNSVGRSASFGCFHSWDSDIIELYQRVSLKERVVIAN